MCSIQYIEKEAFSKYGQVIEFPEDNKESFHIITSEEEHPWRLAVFKYRNKSIKVMENHPTSMESFEPLKGITVLVVAEHEHPDQYEAFILDKPICLYKGIWHQVLALTEEAQVKITENYEVSSEFYTFEKEMEIRFC